MTMRHFLDLVEAALPKTRIDELSQEPWSEDRAGYYVTSKPRGTGEQTYEGPFSFEDAKAHWRANRKGVMAMIVFKDQDGRWWDIDHRTGKSVAHHAAYSMGKGASILKQISRNLRGQSDDPTNG